MYGLSKIAVTVLAILAIALIATALMLRPGSNISNDREAALQATVVAQQSQIAWIVSILSTPTAIMINGSLTSTPPLATTPSLVQTDARLSPVTPEPAQTDTLAPPPDTPVPPTAVPTDTPIPDTPADTILEVGEVWREGGLAITLLDAQISTSDVRMKLQILNERNRKVILTYSEANLSALDNRGERLRLWHFNPGYPWDYLNYREQKIILNSGDKFDDELLAVTFDVANPSVTDVIFGVSNLSSIENARWRIPNLDH
ncbi:MAG: hypothetical protein M3441_13640 [Chloroflexota bacterium]|nr:hypothetical protein [Chloroflexota bacterium]